MPQAGSPPQVRGKPPIDGAEILKRRITPAGAGKTSCELFPSPQGWDHPRRCGENVRKDETGKEKIGSPPQVRGKRTVTDIPPSFIGITPAGAGKTQKAYGKMQ